MFKTSLYLRAQLRKYICSKPFAQLLLIKISAYGFFLLICDNKESKMGYVGGKIKGKKICRQGLIQPMFSPEHLWTATKLPGKPERNCPPGLAGSERCGYNWRIRHFSAWYNHFPYTFGRSGCLPPCTAEQKEAIVCCLELKTTKARGFQRSHRNPVPWLSLLCSPTALWPCLDWSRDTALTHSPCLGHLQTLQAACQAEMQHLALNFSGVSHVSLYIFTAHEHYFLFLHQSPGQPSPALQASLHCPANNEEKDFPKLLQHPSLVLTVPPEPLFFFPIGF